MRTPTPSSVRFHHVSFRHSSAVPVLDHVDLDLAPGWTGIVGSNGAGKTTVLRLVAHELSPTSGDVVLANDAVVVLCSQSVEHLDQQITDFASDWGADATRWRSRLDLDADDAARWPTLSPGTRKRWQIGAALARRPDVLLLDEPTNHLDAGGRDLLLAALARFRGIGLVVSHDRHVLDTLTTRTLRLRAGHVDVQPQSWTGAKAEWDREASAATDAHDRARREEARLRTVLGDVRRSRSAAEEGAAARRRQAGHRNPDAREAGRKIAAAKAEAALARRVRQLGSRVERAEGDTAATMTTRANGGDVGLSHAGGGKRWLAQLRTDEVRAGDRVVLTDVDVGVHRGDRVHVRGNNGAGKTTLLRALVQPGPGVGVLNQEYASEQAAELLREVQVLDPKLRGRVLGTVALLGVDPDRLLVTAKPSPGEVRKVALARLLVEAHDLVVLDEPTNHLDLPSIERLEDALSDYEGALLLVTHDDALAAATTTSTWTVNDGRVTITR